MREKQIRRRRLVLAVVVIVLVVVVLDYVGGSSTSPLNGLHRGISQIAAPIGNGASAFFSPIRDAANWVSSTFHAKSQNSDLKSERSKLLYDLARNQYDAVQLRQAKGLLRLDDVYSMKQYRPVAGHVLAVDPDSRFISISIGLGTANGVKVNDPVIGGGGLVGKVASVTAHESVITLLTAPGFSAGAMVKNANSSGEIVRSDPDNPTSMTLNYVPTHAQISTGQLVLTSGFKDSDNPTVRSLFPPGIPIGRVSTENTEVDAETNQQLSVSPLSEIRTLSLVQVLTRPHPDGDNSSR